MALVFTGTLSQFYKNLSHIPDLLAGNEHIETFRKSSQYRAWENSLRFLSIEFLMSQIKEDCGVLIEYKLPATTRRVDFIVTGYDSKGRPGFVIIELKQWSDAQAVKDKPGVVIANVSGSHREETNHPSYQAWSYKMFLDNMLDSVQKHHLHSVACAYMHNYDYQGLNKDDLAITPNVELVSETPIFGKHDGRKLGDFIQETVGEGKGEKIMQLLADGKVVPSKGLADAICQMFDDVKSQVFTLIDEQKTAYETIMRAVRRTKKGKYCVIISGGPGTGKSVVAVTALVNILREFVDDEKKRNVRFVAPTSSFRTAMTSVLGSGGRTREERKENKRLADYLFSGSMSFFIPDVNDPKKNVYPNNQYHCLICDEAHRLHSYQNMYRGKNQIEDIVQAARVSVFFVDDNQSLRPADIGSVESIKAAADKYSATVEQVDLSAQFRCHGADGFLNWLSVVLGLSDAESNAHATGWNRNEYDFEIVDRPEEVLKFVREKNQEAKMDPIPGRTIIPGARLLAGYAWPWTKENNNLGEVKDVDLGTIQLAWNNRKASYKWAIDNSDRVKEEVGCVHTSQGLEFDWVGVFIGKDLQYDSKNHCLKASIDNYFDKGGKNGLGKTKEEREKNLLKYVCRCYRVLLSRGIRGARVYCCDEALREFLKEKLSQVQGQVL